MSLNVPKPKPPKDLFLIEGISHLVFNKDYTQCALSKKDSKIYLYYTPNPTDYSTWTLYDTLKTHLQYVSGLDWNPVTERLISASYDKTSIIWSYEEGRWGGEYVVATTKVGYLFAHWNEDGSKFVEGTSSKILFIGYYDEESEWWVSRSIKHHKASVMTARIDPTSLFVISGSVDNKIYITSCYIPLVDDERLDPGVLQNAQEFGTVIYKYDADAWILNTKWAFGGEYAYATSYMSDIVVIDYKNQSESVIHCEHSPVMFIESISETSFVAVCYDREIFIYECVDGKWEITKDIVNTKDNNVCEDYNGNKEEENAPGKGVAEELKKFQSSALKSRSSLVITTKKNRMGHQAKISSVNVLNDGSEVITTDLAGFVKVWSL